MTSGEATGETSGATAEDELRVPAVNLNYREVGAPTPEGFVPHHPGDDPTLLRIKEGLKSQGVITPDDELPEGPPALTPAHGTPVPEVPEDVLAERREAAIAAQEPGEDSEPVSQSPLSISGTGPSGESGGTGDAAEAPSDATSEPEEPASDPNASNWP